MTVKRRTKKRALNGGEQRRNKLIAKVSNLGGRSFAVIKRVFCGAHMLVKPIDRVSIKEMLKFIAFNLYQLVALKRKELAAAT